MKTIVLRDKNLYFHPWNMSTLAIGVGLLVTGSFWYDAPDWDVLISILMAGFTYLTAAWVMRVLLLHKLRLLPIALLFAWWSIDGCYALYWYFVNPAALELMRDANWPASTVLFGLCGLIWNVPNLKRAEANG